MFPSPRPRSFWSRVLRELPLDSSVVLIVLIAALATGAGGMLVAAANRPPSAAFVPTSQPDSNVGPSRPTVTPAGNPSGSDEPTTKPTDGPTTTGEPTPPPTETPAPAPTSQPPEALTGYVWPLVNARISGGFDERNGGFIELNGQDVHDGLDLATWCYDRVRAAHSGTVLYAGRKFDPYLGYSKPLPNDFYSHGNLNGFPIVIVIDDGNGYESIYVHLAVAKVGAGDVVKAGEFIGYEGATGHATGCHLHYGLIRMDGPWQEVNPDLVGLYPPQVRERIDPLRVLPLRDPDAATRFLNRYPQPSVPGLPFDPPEPIGSPGV